MQILESSMLGLRTARMIYRNPDSPISVTLYPMVHVGEERFYRETYAEAFASDVVLVEGVRSPVGRNLTRSYRWLNLGKLGLVLQPKPPPQASVSARIVNADLTTEEFHREWRKVSIALRAALFVLAPFYGLRGRFLASRERLARDMSLEDRRSADEVMSWSPTFETFFRGLVHVRDDRLIQCLAAELDRDGVKSVAIVYGARHMRAVLGELARRGFHCAQADWRTILAT